MIDHDDEPTTKVIAPPDAELLAEHRAAHAVDMAAQRLRLDADRMRSVLELPKRKGDDDGT